MDRLKTIIDLLTKLARTGFTGSVEVHFNGGSILKIMQHQRIA